MKSVVLAEGEFNKFYIRALCVRALEEGKNLKVYKTKEVKNPRVESNVKIGEFITDPQRFLNCLRNDDFEYSKMMLHIAPNSVLSVGLVV